MPHQKRPPKAYGNLEFLNSPDARTIRILAEYHEPLSRFRRYGIENSIVFFGSSRSMDPDELEKRIASNPEKFRNDAGRRARRLSAYYDEAVELSRRLTEWSFRGNPGKQSYYICSGGGPGMMEAANRGAHLAGGKSIGLNISIPTEQYPNPYISEELKFEFHYFFIRKFWFIYLAKALVIFPGGFGTLDELMEVLTLIQTEKVRKTLPIVIYGTEYWNDIINIEEMVKWGTIDVSDLKLFHMSDDVDDAFAYLTARIDANGGPGAKD